MDISTPPATGHTAVRTTTTRLLSSALVAGLLTLSTAGATTDATPAGEVTDGATGRPVPRPDRIGEHAGGIAARVRVGSGAPIPGDVFLLLARAGSTVNARVYDRTPYAHDGGVHEDTLESNRVAARAVESITRSGVELLELTSAPGGGASAGLAYAIAYLDIVSDGAFTGDLRVAATGRLGDDGHIDSIDHIDLKTPAAHLAGADVLFTPSAPSGGTLDAYAARFVGEAARPAEAAVTLNDPRRIEAFERWGASRPAGMDVVDARHLIDVAAYLCGSGSPYACLVSERLDEQARRLLDDRHDEARSESERLRVVVR